MSKWPTVPLGDVLEIQNGFAFESKKFSLTGKIGLIRIRDLRSGTTTETRYSGEYGAAYVVNKGEYLIGMDGEFRCYEWKGEPALLNQRVCRLRGFSKDLDLRYLFYGLNAHLVAIEANTGYTTVKHLSSRQVLGIEMPFPPLDEQKRIVALLDETKAQADEIASNAARSLACQAEVKASVLRNAFEGAL